jgi:phage baseplate assembly protein W
MLPTTSNITNDEIVIVEQPSYTYKQLEQVIQGHVDNIEAVKQSIKKILSTERYDYLIYDWNYGLEIKDLIGKDKLYAYSELKKRISEALLQDDRIISVSNFVFDSNKTNVTIQFLVTTVYGDLNENLGVNI